MNNRILSLLLCVILASILLFPAIVRASTYSAAVLADSPVRYYRLGEDTGTNANDESANNQDGTYTNGAVLGAQGAILSDASNTAVVFDGTNDYVSLPVLNLQSTSFTFEAWIYPDASAGDYSSVLSLYDGSHDGTLFFRGSTLKKVTFAFNPSTNFIQTGNDTLLPGIWHHIVVVYDISQGVAIYIDGTNRVQAAIGAYGGSTTPVANIGLRNNAWNPFAGKIDEVAIYASALSQARIQAHYVAAGYSLPTTTPTPTITPTPTLAPWTLATLPGSGQTYQISYDIRAGEIAIVVIGLIMIGLSVFKLILALIQR